ncbi:MAG: acetate--CoA ligase family protein, partial [Thermoplasmata archaeon]|nr:acetate--CoA ligase family protein [Thermoplasmata archaeon]
YSLLEAYGIPTARWRVVDDAEDAVAAAGDIGYPVVVKAESSEVVHKSDAGGVALDLGDAGAVRSAVEGMRGSIDAADLRFLVQEQVPRGTEVVVGANAGAGTGHLVMFGLGGVLVDLLGDVAFEAAPVTRPEAERMLASVRGKALLDGFRGSAPVDRGALVDIITRVSQLVSDNPSIAEMDLNPIIATPGGSVVVDARVRKGGAG